MAHLLGLLRCELDVHYCIMRGAVCVKYIQMARLLQNQTNTTSDDSMEIVPGDEKITPDDSNVVPPTKVRRVRTRCS